MDAVRNWIYGNTKALTRPIESKCCASMCNQKQMFERNLD